MKLSECENRKEFTVKEIVESDFDDKLMEYGVVPGAQIVVVNKALFNGPIYIAIDSQKIAIRKQEASYIIVE